MRETDEATEERRVAQTPFLQQLSTRLFAVTALAVLVAEVLIFGPSIANFRRDWLSGKLETVAVATLVSEFGEGGALLSPEQEAELLHALDAKLIAIAKPDSTKLLARVADVGTVDETIDLEREGPLASVVAAFDTLLSRGDRLLRLVGPIGDGSLTGELVIREQPLRGAMLAYSSNILLLSLAIASFAGGLVFGAISLFLLRPIRRMTQAMTRFAADPEDPERLIVPSLRQDELCLAERELAGMQDTLARTLREQRHLADLGLAVSKINHDLRNILASAQLVSDRLSDLPDAQVQRFAPVLIRSLDRALAYTQSVLAYGQAAESRPVRRRILLARLVDEIFEMQHVPPERGIELVNSVPPGFEIDVDPEQMFRTLSNLVRNGIQAVDGDDAAAAIVRRVRVEAGRGTGGGVRIAVEDTGPGLSEGARLHLFKAFRGSTRAGGTGLGLAIAAEIVQAHGGRIALSPAPVAGARFEIDLPLAAGAEPAAP